MFCERRNNQRGGGSLLFIAAALVVLFLVSGSTMSSINQEQKKTNEQLVEISTRMTRMEVEQTRQGKQLDFIVDITEKIWGAVQFLRNLEVAQIVGSLFGLVGVYLFFRRERSSA